MSTKPFASALAALALAVGLTAVPAVSGHGAAEARTGAKPVARNDQASAVVGSAVRVKVLANDTVTRKPRAVVKIVKAPKHLRASVKGKTIRVHPKKAGTFKVRYRVIDVKKRKAVAVARITVTKASPQSPAPAPAPTGNLVTLIEDLDVAAEVRTGYDRDTFKHWNSGLPTTAGGIANCNTRHEVLISESLVPATWTKSTCGSMTGSWYSYYDGVTTTNPSTFDIDHMVPLAEAHDSGAWAWDLATKEAFANDQGDPRSLVAVSASSNRSKSDRDPGEWWPVRERCRYAAEWVAVKTRWDLRIDQVEKDALLLQATQCTDLVVEVITR